MLVFVYPDQREDARRLAAVRDADKYAHGIGRHNTYDGGKGSTEAMHAENALAELVVAATIGGEVDRGVSTRGNKAGNIILPDGRRGFAKYRGQRGWDFALKTKTMVGFHGDVGFLVWPGPADQPAMVDLVGWIDRDTFAKHARIVSYRNGWERLAVKPYHLFPMYQLTAPDEVTQAETTQQIALFD